MPNQGDYNLEFRPESYWAFGNPQQAILANVKGDLRREMIRILLAAGEPVAAELLDESLPDDLLAAFGRLDPAFMGGEYLPNHKRGEVEIARITLESVTQDVYSIRARHSGDRIRYRIVDEYESKWTWLPQSSKRPLAMTQLVEMIDRAECDGEGPPDFTDYLRNWIIQWDDNSEVARDFVTVSSEFYPELEAYYAEKAREWYARRASADGTEDKEES